MIIVEVNDLMLLNNKLIDNFLIGLDGVSSECYKHFSYDEVEAFVVGAHALNKKVWLDLTNVYHDADIPKLEKIINHLMVDGFFYNDLGLQLIIPYEKRFYYAPTYMTNQRDLKIMKDENKYVLISPELSFEEMTKIEESNQYFLLAFGTWEIFHSRRNLISNYYNYRKWEITNSTYAIEEETRNDKYPIVEKNGTKIYLNRYYYLGQELEKLNFNLLFKVYDLPLNLTNRLIDIYLSSLKSGNYQAIEPLLKELNIPLNKGLLYESSILVKEAKDETN